jgi:hypothetical protein
VNLVLLFKDICFFVAEKFSEHISLIYGEGDMALVQEIKQAVSQLSQEDLSQFRQWFEAFDAHIWDQQFEHDAKSGKLDAVADRAIADYRNGKCREL